MKWNSSKNYSDGDMMRMQQDAIQRVKEMQVKAEKTLQNANSEHGSSQQSLHINNDRPNNHMNFDSNSHNIINSNIGGSNNQQHITHNQASSVSKTIDSILDSGSNLVSNVMSYFTGTQSEEGEDVELSPIAVILKTLHLDSERLIVLGLLIVLMNEKADKTMLLALFYLLF